MPVARKSVLGIGKAVVIVGLVLLVMFLRIDKQNVANGANKPSPQTKHINKKVNTSKANQNTQKKSSSLPLKNSGSKITKQESKSINLNKTNNKVSNSKVTSPPSSTLTQYPLHRNIVATEFWVGEYAGQNTGNIDDIYSSWDMDWINHFGGIDNPESRNGYFPAKFIPKENPFYAALPYNDFDNNGNRKASAWQVVPWAGTKTWGALESMLKNQWIKVIKGSKVAYAQWEDCGPYGEDDPGYVFGDGTVLPKNKLNKNAGIDLSPAVEDYLGLTGDDVVDWQFVDFKDVPNGPWKQIITISQIYWE